MLNRVQIIGRLGADPDLIRGEWGTRCRLSIATDNPGDAAPDWHRVIVWDALAETCAQYLEKGRLVHVEGSIHYTRYTDSQRVERTGTEIRAHRVLFLPGATGAAVDRDSREPEPEKNPQLEKIADLLPRAPADAWEDRESLARRLRGKSGRF
jgi:single-strand DNA-binding protein